MNPISIVVPDGSMQEVITKLLIKAGLPVTIDKKRTKEGKVNGVDWIKGVAFQRPQEIPHYLENGHFDVAIVGEDWIANWGYTFPVLAKLPIGRSGNKPVKIVLAVSQTSNINCINYLPRKSKIATEYTGLAEKLFTLWNRQDVQVVPSFGNTEHKVKFGITGIIDVTESGDSLQENELKIIHQLMESNIVLVANRFSFHTDDRKRSYIDCFTRLIQGAYTASNFVMLIANVPTNVINEASKIMGGLKGPSCSPLQGITDWFALQSIVPKEKEHVLIFELLQIGVTDIIVNRDIPLIMT